MRCGMFLVPSSAADIAAAVVVVVSAVVVAVSLAFLIRLWHYKCKTAHKAKQCRARLCTHTKEKRVPAIDDCQTPLDALPTD